MKNSLRRDPRYRIGIWLLLILCVIVLLSLNQSIVNNPDSIIGRDFSHYWAAGRLSLQGKNPYDPTQINQIKTALNLSNKETSLVPITYNPPWALAVFIPFSLTGFSSGRLMWLIVNITILIVCANWVWRIYNGPNKLRWVPTLVAFTLGPVILALSLGQAIPFVLLGIVGFLDQVEKRGSDWLAGFFAALISIKPQLFYLFWVVLILWVIDRKRWKVPISLGMTLVIATIIGTRFNITLVPQYVSTLLTYSPMVWISPTIGSYLRMLFGAQRLWLQLIPAIVGTAWGVYYWLKHRTNWRWRNELPLILFVSLLSTPFGWTSDYALLIAAVIPAVILLRELPSKKLLLIFTGIYLLLNSTYLISHRFYAEHYFGWLLPVLFILYLLAVRAGGGYPGGLRGTQYPIERDVFQS